MGWRVGRAATGTISATGLYTPPATIPTPGTVTITAVGHGAAGLTSSIAESILNPVPVVTFGAGDGDDGGWRRAYTLDVLGTGFISGSVVQVAGATVPVTFVSSTEMQQHGDGYDCGGGDDGSGGGYKS